MSKQNINFSIFSDKSLGLGTNAIAMLPKSDVLSFTGDIICTNPVDVKLAICAERNINIKFICHEHYLNMQDWFTYEDNIEYLIGIDDEQRPEYERGFNLLIKSLIGLKNIRTLNEYLL